MEQSDAFTMTEVFSIDYTNSGKESRKPIGHFHDSYELAFFIRADIDIFVKDTKYRVQDGDLLLINAFDLHRIFYNPNHEYTRYVIQFKESFIYELLRTLQLEQLVQKLQQKQNKKISLTIKQRVKLEETFRNILNLHKKKQVCLDDPTLEPALKVHLLLLLLEYHKLSDLRRSPRKFNPIENQVHQIIQYIDEHYSETLQLNDLSVQFGKSKYYISHSFQQVTRFTFVEYLQYRRVIEAQKKLLQTDIPIIDIGLECGFQSLQHFYRVFKKISKQTPAAYRKENK
ncbi:AraC-type DNA-binding protein [Paenibacillus sp. 1_12]|uniref:AraC family transcriptional regulator n=1 Tax=Paenibacillus sp. 1_12 TaxID=1566278 RepID=UPI0008EF6312|nr:AraC family transcriptional regulator [Paenibacillus sp. 1_12]SFL07965.1 AraC-type DNA-binding protein [Paenibacillus sp. 1_12]